MSLSHHDGCFGCGIANLFGLQMELESTGEGSVAGRFFVKQDHQGPPGSAHGGIVGAALDEAMALVLHADGVHARTRRYEVDLHMPAPVGSWVNVRTRLESDDGKKIWVTATAGGEGGTIAEGRALFVAMPNGA